jgi:hypothetical protein
LMRHFYGRREQKTYREEIKYLDKLNTSNYFFREKVMNYRKLFSSIAMASVIGYGIQANAEVIQLELDNTAQTVQYGQTENRPCIIGENSCPGSLAKTPLPNGPQQQYDVTTDAYLVGSIRALVTDYFYVGIDVNSDDKPFASEYLDLFEAIVRNGDVIVDTYIYNPVSPGTQLLLNQGTGKSDALLKTFDLSTYLTTYTITFHTIINTPTDGKEQFFLIKANDGNVIGEIPEPGTTAILGLGLLGMGFISLRGKKKQS